MKRKGNLIAESAMLINVFLGEEVIEENLDLLGGLCDGGQQEMPFMLTMHREQTPSPSVTTCSPGSTTTSGSGSSTITDPVPQVGGSRASIATFPGQTTGIIALYVKLCHRHIYSSTKQSHIFGILLIL